MKKILLLLLFYPVLAGFCQPVPDHLPRTFKLASGLTEKDYLPNTVIVKFRVGSTAAQIRAATAVTGAAGKLNMKSAGIKQISQVFRNSLQLSANPAPAPGGTDTIGLDRIYELKLTGNPPVEDVINELLQNPLVEYAEPSYIYHSSYIPNDTYYASAQDHLRQIGADRAWDIIRNSSGIIIAIVDSGSDMDHIDLRANLILPGKDLVGASFSEMKEDDDPDVKSDSTDHGVRVSGIASAVSDNGTGIASAGFNARLMIIKAGADNDATSIYKGYEGIKYAADNGAHIINCSWGGPGGGGYGQDIINYAISKGCMIVAAAGNGNSEEVDYPAAYQGVMSVTSVDYSDRKSSFSNYGSRVDISAPGEVFTTANGNRYTLARGTSFCTPLVSSAAALVKSRFPQFNMSQVQEQLRITSDYIDSRNPGYAGLLGKGRLNLFRAVTETLPSVRQQKIILVDKGRGSIPPGDTLKIFFDIRNFLSEATGLRLALSSDNPGVKIIDQERNIGTLGTLQTLSMVGEFRVYINPDIPDNEQVRFKISYTADQGYADSEQFNIRVALDYLNIEVNKISTTLSSNGRVGFSGPDATDGLGFLYNGRQLLYEASLMIGNSASRVSNNARNDLGSADEHFLKKVRAGKVDGGEAAFRGISEFDDSGSPNPLDLYVKHSQTAFASAPDDKYSIAEYEVKNTGQAVLNGVYVGILSDWDLDVSGEVTKYDSENRMGYVYGKSPGTVYAGVKLLSQGAGSVYYPMSYNVPGDPLQTGGGFSIAEKYRALSGGIKASSLGEARSNEYDVMFVSGYGPFTIPVNGSVKVAFAFLAGDNLEELQAGAGAAQRKYNEIRGEDPYEDGGFALGQNFPNPSHEFTSIRFSVPESGQTSLILYDMLGRKVRELVNASLSRGSYNIDVNISDLRAGVYLYKMQFKGHEKTLRLIVAK